MSLTVGQDAPTFNLVSTHGDIDLSKLKGKIIVLYFYPKDSTPGCTTQAQNFRDAYHELEGLNVIVLGVSRDSLKSHENFTAKQNIPYPLIVDNDETLCLAYDVIKMKNMYGKQVRGIERSTFLIDTQGKIAHIWRGVKVKEHLQEVLDAVQQLNQD